MDRVLLLLSEDRKSYEDQFDNHIWNEKVDGVTMDTYVKDDVRDTVEHLLFLTKMAADLDIDLTEDENNLLNQAAEQYMSDYDAGATLPFTKDTVRAYYKDLLLGEKAFYAITGSVDTEVSTDEARIIDVQYLFFSKSAIDEDGNLISLSTASINKKRQKANNVLGMIREGEDIINLVKEYSDDSKYFLELGRGDYEEKFEEAAFALEMGEVSDVVEAHYGFYIIKCTNDNVSDDYEKRKESIVLERRKELFAKTYSKYSDGVMLHYNDSFWTDYSVSDIPKGSGKLQAVFDEFFVSTH